ncbi:MAG: DUF1778 domain-containing protein [Desulfovibrio sp.]|nr:DUF1778 domain-containing protein [Desulfovibrio sp.]
MTQQHEKMSRIDARIPLSIRDTIDRAAAFQGRSRTDFLISAAIEKAEHVIAEQTLIRLSLRDQEVLSAALSSEEPRESPSFLASVAEEYEASVRSE